MNEVYITAAKRTPIGGFQGSLSKYSATKLGSIAIKGVMDEVQLPVDQVSSVYMGHVLTASAGQSTARQAAKFAGIPDTADATTINKVCASGMKSIMIGAQQILLGVDNVVITGGMESMSNVPHYLHLRNPAKIGNSTAIDGILKDGLTDVYNEYHMGYAAELVARKYNISREAQDEYAIASYEKAKEATTAGYFLNEIAPVQINERSILSADEDVDKLILEKIPKLHPSFDIHGTITPANASNLNDGASALILMSLSKINELEIKPVAKIIGYADAAQDPIFYATSPSIAIPKALQSAGLKIDDIDYFEINEAYAAVAIANQKILKLDTDKLNIWGGAVAMGHPLGASGARIVCTLISILKARNGKYGVAAICNGGGGASAVVIENLQ